MTRRILAAALAAAAALSAPARAQDTVPRPTLVVFLTVDQLRTDYFTRWEHQLTGGLARLWRDGAFFTDAHQDHAITETAPGHASTLSGRVPAHTGIVANAYGVQDPQVEIVGGTGEGASPFRFRGSTLIDWMRVADPRSRALSVSRKDRGAIFPLGRAVQDVFWYVGRGRFGTSTYYADTLPAWVQRFNARRIPASLAGQAWTLLLPDSAYPEPDSVPAEAGGENFVFPHVLPSDPDSVYASLSATPFMDAVTLRLALAGMREMELGRGPHPDLLAVSLSATDYVGHRYGPDSREAHDQVLRLDRMLAAFMDSVEAYAGPSRVVFALTADHGVASLPAVAYGDSADAFHVDVAPVVDRTRAALAAAGVPESAFTMDDALLFLDRGAFRGTGVDPDTLLRGFAAALRGVPGVARVDLVDELRAMDPAARDDVERRWVNMIPRDQPIPLVVTLRPGAVFGPRSYAMHGTPHAYDTRVPVAFLGAPFRAGRYDAFARVVDMAPTLAAVLGVAPTEPLDGVVLERALR